MNKWQQQVYDMLRSASRNNLPCTIPADVTHIPANMMLEADKSKWISVKDRLPEPDTKVLVYGRNEYGVYCITCLYSAHRKWLYHNRMTADGETITHWMPLPKPPNEG